MAKQKLYAIKDETHKLIVDSWDECQKILKECTNPKYKSFSTKEDAENFLNDIVSKPIEGPTAYIDGSYDINTGCYSFGGILLIDGNEYKFKKKYEPDEYAQYRNVAGEIKGAAYVINYAIKLGIKELNLYYDYMGIEQWYLGKWKANTTISENYVNFANSVKDKITVNFHKVKSHTNNHYNDVADILAKEALK